MSLDGLDLTDLRTWADTLVAGRSWVFPLTALLGAFVFGQVLAWTYERTYRGLSYSRGFSHTLVLVCIAASILVLAMQFSLLAGLGLFGILSMIRFRTDLKTPRDLVFVMGAATVGVACGVGAMLEAAMGMGAFSLVALYLYTGPFGSRTRFDGVLRFRLSIDVETEPTLSRLMRRTAASGICSVPPSSKKERSASTSTRSSSSQIATAKSCSNRSAPSSQQTRRA